MADAELQAGGFRRILVRLDEGTRRKYCSRALAEDLQDVKRQMRACVAAMRQTRQVEDATRTLDAKQARVRSEGVTQLLAEIETLYSQLETATTALFTQGADVGTAGEEDNHDAKFQEAKTLVKQVLQTHDSKDIEAAVDKAKQLERLMPVVANVPEKRQRWWKKHMQKVIDHALQLVKADTKQFGRATTRLLRVAKKAADKCPSLADWFESLETGTMTSKKRLIALPDDGEAAVVSTSTPTKRAKSSSPASNISAGKEHGKVQRADKARSLLHRCSREVRTLRDKFDLASYDVNLSRAVTIVDSLWPGLEHSELVALTMALFTLVETTEKISNLSKRRDRLVCLESVLGVVLGNSTLKMSARRKTMIEEYANNCRQSLEQLNRPSEGKASEQRALKATTSSAASTKGDQAAWPRNHVRFG